MAAGKFLNAVLCEDARREISGKFILIGVYAGEIVVSAFPAELALLIYVEFIPVRAGEQSLRFRFTPSGQEPVVIDGKVEVANPKQAVAITTPPFRMIMEDQTEFRADASLDEGKWQRLFTKLVKRGDVRTS